MTLTEAEHRAARRLMEIADVEGEEGLRKAVKPLADAHAGDRWVAQYALLVHGMSNPLPLLTRLLVNLRREGASAVEQAEVIERMVAEHGA